MTASQIKEIHISSTAFFHFQRTSPDPASCYSNDSFSTASVIRHAVHSVYPIPPSSTGK